MNVVPSDSLAYLATPYSKYPGGPDAAFKAAARLAGLLMLTGIKVYSPIVHSHPLAMHAKIDALDHAIWLPFDETMMAASKVLIVAQLPTWQESKGVAQEIEFFERHGKPIFYCNPETLRMHPRRESSRAFDLARKDKFARGVAEHGPGWPNVNAPKEIMEECCDIANYAELLADRGLAAWATNFARRLWWHCNELQRQLPAPAHGKPRSEHAGSSEPFAPPGCVGMNFPNGGSSV